MSFGLAGLMKGVGSGIAENARSKREFALRSEDFKRLMIRDEANRDFEREMTGRKEDFVREQTATQAPKPTAKMQEYRIAQEQGFEGSFLDYQRELQTAGATNVTTNIGGDKFEEGMAKHQATLLGTLYESGLKATQDLGLIDRLDGLFRQFDTGGKAAIKQFAGEFGIESEGLDEIQTAQAIINKMVPEQRPAGSGPMSDADLALFKQSLPRVINQPGGNALIIDTLKGIALYQQEQGKIAQLVMTGQMGRKEAFEALGNLENPLAEFNKALGQSGKDRAKTIRQKYGLE